MAAGAAAGSALIRPSSLFAAPASAAGGKKRLALIGTGVRGISFWGKTLIQNYSGQLEFVGLCDNNPGRVAYAKQYMEADCPTFTNFTEMMDKTRPDLLIVTTVDATHDEYIVKGLQMGADVITEKPMTTDEVNAKSRAENKPTQTAWFNHAMGPLYKIKELLASDRLGE